MNSKELMGLLRIAFMRGYGAGKSSDENTNPTELWEHMKNDIVFEIALEKLLTRNKESFNLYQSNQSLLEEKD